MKKFLLWLGCLFSSKNKIIETPRIQISSTGTQAITDESREKYLKALKACIDSRVKEYPSWEEIVEALADAELGDDSKLNVIKRRRRLVKEKYPKPTY